MVVLYVGIGVDLNLVLTHPTCYRKKDAQGKIKNKNLKIPLSSLTIFMMTRDASVTTSPSLRLFIILSKSRLHPIFSIKEDVPPASRLSTTSRSTMTLR